LVRVCNPSLKEESYMPITPGKCPPSTPTGGGPLVCPDFTEKDCIEVFKVYDQCATEELLGSSVPASTLCPGVVIPPGSTITCTVVPGSATCFFIGFGPFNPPFFRPVFVQNQVQVSVTVINPAGVIICGPTPITLQGVVEALLWAPTGVSVQCSILNVGPCTCQFTTDPATGAQLISCRVKVCKEIQIKALVKLLVPSYGFCELGPCIPVPQPEFPCPSPSPLFPPQKCQDPPTAVIQDFLGIGITGVTVTLNRQGTLIPAVTGANGIATFTTVGGFAGGIDTISFTDTLAPFPVKTFAIPTEFIDPAGVAHDSDTVCQIVFRRTAIEAHTFNVFMDGFQNGVVDP
jgi:hypothetical protein